MKPKKIFIALPIYKPMFEECRNSIMDFIYGKQGRDFEVGEICQLRGSPNIYMQRHNLALNFLKTDCDYYLYLDCDQVIHTPDTIKILIDDNKDIISALIVRRFFPHLPACISKSRRKSIEAARAGNIKEDVFLEDFRDYPQDRPYEVDYSCGGFVLIKRRVIEQVHKPFYPVVDNASGNLLSVDYSLYYKAKELGFTCWIEPRIKISHIGQYEFLPDDYYALLDSGELKVSRKDGKDIYELTPQQKEIKNEVSEL